MPQLISRLRALINTYALPRFGNWGPLMPALPRFGNWSLTPSAALPRFGNW